MCRTRVCNGGCVGVHACGHGWACARPRTRVCELAVHTRVRDREPSHATSVSTWSAWHRPSPRRAHECLKREHACSRNGNTPTRVQEPPRPCAPARCTLTRARGCLHGACTLVCMHLPACSPTRVPLHTRVSGCGIPCVHDGCECTRTHVCTRTQVSTWAVNTQGPGCAPGLVNAQVLTCARGPTFT